MKLKKSRLKIDGLKTLLLLIILHGDVVDVDVLSNGADHCADLTWIWHEWFWLEHCSDSLQMNSIQWRFIFIDSLLHSPF